MCGIMYLESGKGLKIMRYTDMDKMWKAGFCRGFFGNVLDNPRYHSTAFLDGFDTGKEFSEQIEGSEIEPLNARSDFVRGILQENRELKLRVKSLLGENS